MSQDDSISCRAAGRKGGEYIRDTYGTAHYRKLGERGGKTTVERHGKAHLSEIGRRGGATTAARHGKEFYAQIADAAAIVRKELIKRGKALEAEDGK